MYEVYEIAFLLKFLLKQYMGILAIDYRHIYPQATKCARNPNVVKWQPTFFPALSFVCVRLV